MNVRELFRSKLENSEVIPDDSVRNELMRKITVKEFMRFNPSRFNIYYIGGIAVTALAAILIFTSEPDSNRDQNGKTRPDTSGSSDKITIVEPEKQFTGELPAEKKPDAGELNTEASRVFNKPAPVIGVNKTDIKAINIRKDSTGAVTDSLKKTLVFVNNLSGRNRRPDLQRTINASFEASSSGGCTPLKVKFRNNSISYDSCRWVFGDGGFSNEKNPEWIFDLVGEYKIILKVFNSNGTHAIASTVINVHPSPVARFEITPQKPVIPDDEIRFLNNSVDAVRYKWEFGDGNTSNTAEPYHKYRKYKEYNVRLIAWSEYGCSDTMLVINAFTGSGCYIDFPNAFIPGSDGPVGGYYSTKTDEASRIFHPVTSGVTDYNLRIFSKLGILIFESNDINIGWDGYMKGQLCEPGVYIWKVRGSYKNGEPFVKMGDITLLKN